VHSHLKWPSDLGPFYFSMHPPGVLPNPKDVGSFNPTKVLFRNHAGLLHSQHQAFPFPQSSIIFSLDSQTRP
jgi:hypothetical protein